MTYVNLAQSQEALVAEQAKNMIYASHGCIRRYELADRLNYSGEYLSRIMKKYTGYTLKLTATKYKCRKPPDSCRPRGFPSLRSPMLWDMKTEPSSITISKKNFT